MGFSTFSFGQGRPDQKIIKRENNIREVRPVWYIGGNGSSRGAGNGSKMSEVI